MYNCRLAIAALGLGFAVTTSAAGPFEAAQNQSSGATVVDAKGQLVGYSYSSGLLRRNINGTWYTLEFNYFGFTSGRFGLFNGTVYYTNSDCKTGDKYFVVQGDDVTIPAGITPDARQPNPGYVTSVTVNFPKPPLVYKRLYYYYVSPRPSIMRSGCMPTPNPVLVGLAQSTHLSFSAPFTLK